MLGSLRRIMRDVSTFGEGLGDIEDLLEGLPFIGLALLGLASSPQEVFVWQPLHCRLYSLPNGFVTMPLIWLQMVRVFFVDVASEGLVKRGDGGT